MDTALDLKDPQMGDAGVRDSQQTRRRFLSSVGLGALALGLAACGSSSGSPTSGTSSATSHSATEGAPRRGGTLTVGLTGGGSSDTLNPLQPLLTTDFARIDQLFEPLVGFTPEAGLQLLLAEELTPNHDATEWTIRLRRGITFHNGKDLTAADVAYTLQQIRSPKYAYGGASAIESIDLAGMKQLDKLTLRVPFKTPLATLNQVFPCYYYSIVPVDFDPKRPVGTGPFKYQSFTPGESSTFVRNENYWQSGLPYLDQVVITDFSDETSQLDALGSGQVDAVGLLSAASIGTAQSSSQVVISRGGGWTPFTMRVDVAPFSDVRVRQALRYAIDRQQMLDVVFAGHGTIGNDLFGIWDPAYDTSIPQRPHDPEMARSLLRQAGHSGLSIQLITADIAQGTISAAQLLQQQARAAGINVSLRQITTTDLYGPNYLKWAFAQDYWYYNPYMPQVAAAMLPTSPTNECHFDNPRYIKLYQQAVATTNEAIRTQIIHEMQQIEYEEGGYIIPYFPPIIDAYGHNVRGYHASNVGVPLGNYDLKHLWLV
ncbi:MAG TPA: ABC transporter substrate-binding protein [Solirubrobacteraceae bacterium]|nr:ABC transporter substrate-binding protein [Solirubrobacteraceae bacterium]